MARRVEIKWGGQVKIINPWIPFLLSFFTLGLYYIFWYGIRNSELNDFGSTLVERPDENPLAVESLGSMAAITIGALVVIPPFISEWRFYKRIGRAQALVGVDDPINPV